VTAAPVRVWVVTRWIWSGVGVADCEVVGAALSADAAALLARAADEARDASYQDLCTVTEHEAP
jgi:hypothetical protein